MKKIKKGNSLVVTNPFVVGLLELKKDDIISIKNILVSLSTPVNITQITIYSAKHKKQWDCKGIDIVGIELNTELHSIKSTFKEIEFEIGDTFINTNGNKVTINLVGAIDIDCTTSTGRDYIHNARKLRSTLSKGEYTSFKTKDYNIELDINSAEHGRGDLSYLDPPKPPIQSIKK